eukprot:49046-Amphidinium_carterae.1
MEAPLGFAHPWCPTARNKCTHGYSVKISPLSTSWSVHRLNAPAVFRKQGIKVVHIELNLAPACLQVSTRSDVGDG